MTHGSDARLARILKLHFDAAGGSPYWIQKERQLGFCVTEEVRSVRDLWRLGPMRLEDLAEKPVQDFIPQCFIRSRRPLVTAETGGATGDPKTAAYFADEFEEIFVDSFVKVARAAGFRDGGWLWVGPGGPHIIGKAAMAIARKMSGSDAFSVDFDPRWYRSLAPGSIARGRYMEHLIGQAMRVAARERITNLFSTPVVLSELARRMDAAARERIGGIHLGGMALTEETMTALSAAFPAARFVSGYGNTLFGVCHAAGDLRGRGGAIRYFPQGERLVLRLVSSDPDVPAERRIREEVPSGADGQVMFHRLDESMFLPNVLERDRGVRVGAGEAERKLGFAEEGVEGPGPLQTRLFTVDAGIY